MLLVSLCIFGQNTTSGIVKLSEEIDRLENDKRNKQRQITSLQNQISILTSANNDFKLKNDELLEVIAGKTSEIYVLRGQISDILSDYESLIEEYRLLELENEENRTNIERLKAAKEKLEEELHEQNTRIKSQTDSLRQLGYENVILSARNQALNERIEDLLELRVNYAFIEFNYILFTSYDISLSIGKLIKGKTLYAGLRVGYENHFRRNSTLSFSREQLDLIPLTAQVRFPLSKRSFAKKYVDPFEPVRGSIKYYGSIDFGYAKEISASPTSAYNKGGTLAILSVGGIFNFFEITNAYVNIGVDFQQLKRKNSEFAADDKTVRFGLRLGGGVSF